MTSADEKRRKSPSLGMALRIQSATGGMVTLADWPKLAEIAYAFHENERGDEMSRLQGPDKSTPSKVAG